MQMVMTRDDDDGGPRPGWSDDDANMWGPPLLPPPQSPPLKHLFQTTSLFLREGAKKEPFIHESIHPRLMPQILRYSFPRTV